jgi:hypothetical protein
LTFYRPETLSVFGFIFQDKHTNFKNIPGKRGLEVERFRRSDVKTLRGSGGSQWTVDSG